MPCRCRERMKWLEEKAPKVAEKIRPAHDAAMKVVDAVDRRFGESATEIEEPAGR